MQLMRRLILGLVASLAILAVGAPPAEAEDETSAEAKAQQGEGPSAVLDNTPGATPENVESRDSGARQTACHLILDNRAPWMIKLYVDNGYVGTAPRNGEIGSWWRNNREYRVYGRADFTDGTWRFWGPQTLLCVNRYTLVWHP